MKKYSLVLSSHIPSNTRIPVYELCKNGESLFESFFNIVEIDENSMSSIAATVRIIEDTANLQRRPKSHFRLIKGHKLKCKIYEAKSDAIRVYLFHEENTGRIIITGGYKNTQKEDIKRIQNIIKEYLYETNMK